MTGGAEVKKKTSEDRERKKRKRIRRFPLCMASGELIFKKIEQKNVGTQREKESSVILGKRARISLFHLVNSFKAFSYSFSFIAP